jgi:phosphoglycolate phosphatase
MQGNIFFDLDGTLLDSRNRLFNLFTNLVPKSNLSIQEYWELKRSKIDHKSILTKQFNYTENDFYKFEKTWLSNIELLEYLQFDAPVDAVFEVLDYLAQKYELYIVTSRQSKKNVIMQLRQCNLHKYFKDVLVTEHICEKKELIQTQGYSKNDFLIGDTGYDVLTGIALGINTIAVTYGFLKKEVLEAYHPHYTIDMLKDIRQIV